MLKSQKDLQSGYLVFDCRDDTAGETHTRLSLSLSLSLSDDRSENHTSVIDGNCTCRQLLKRFGTLLVVERQLFKYTLFFLNKERLLQLVR